jgi:hypothetical protein
MQGNINLTCNLPKNVNVSFGLTCKDFRIYKFPVTVTCIELDNFYKLKTYSFKGTNQYDQEFLKFVKINRLQIDHQSNSNCLFFTGKLIYNITSPISGMIFGDFRHYKEIQ